MRDFLSQRKQRVVLGNSKSDWADVTSGIPQGSVLGPVLFVIFINDLPDTIKSYSKIFADDTKIFRALKSTRDISILQDDLQNLSKWSKTWQLPFNIPKCKVLHYGKNNPEFTYMMENCPLKNDTSEKDLGVTFDSDYTFGTHIRNIVAKANSRVGIIKRTFTSLNTNNFKILYKSLTRPILEYCSPIWSPHLRKDIDEIERVQRRATKLVKGLAELSYEERLRKLDIPTLAYRRIRADILQTYKILKGHDSLNPRDFFQPPPSNTTRGHSLKIFKQSCNTSERQHTFSQRVVSLWNNLPENIVNCETINSFKSAIDKRWKDVPLKFNPTGAPP